MVAAYTWSKSLSYSHSAIDDLLSQDVYNRRIEKSPSPVDVPHFFKLSWIYELPIGPDRLINLGRIGNLLAGG